MFSLPRTNNNPNPMPSQSQLGISVNIHLSETLIAVLIGSCLPFVTGAVIVISHNQNPTQVNNCSVKQPKASVTPTVIPTP